MRIALVVHKLPPHSVGGVEIYTQRVARALADKGHRVAIFYRHDRQETQNVSAAWEELEAGVWGYGVSYNPQGVAASIGSQFLHTFLNRAIEQHFRAFMGAFAPQLVHVQHVLNLSARIIPLARQARLPVVLTLHDYWFLCSNAQLIWPNGEICSGKAWGMHCVHCAAAARYPSRFIEGIRPLLAPLFIYRDLVVRQAALRANHFIAPSHFLIQQYTANGFPKDRITYLENGIPLAQIRRFPPTPTTGKMRIAFIGSLAWQKGVHILAEAFRELPQGLATLRIWGDPTVFPTYVEKVRQILRGCDAQLMGPLENDRVGEALADSDVLVVPSLWYENSPIVIQEAWAAQVPVIVSGHGALAEKVRHGVNGLHFPPGDAKTLCRLLAHLAMDRESLTKLRAGISPPMDMESHVASLLGIYEQL